jgi:predicted O-methyltransferase YrrM
MMSLLQECFRRSQSGSDIHAHLPRLFELASIPHVKVIELGVRGGDSTAAFLAAAEEQGGEVWSVDIADPRVPADWRDLPFWYLTVGDDLDVADQLPDNVDIVFIDTSHTYEQTKQELELYVGKVKPGGLIVLHDTELKRPEASPPSDPDFPVAQAVAEFVSAGPYRSVEWVEGCYGLGIITVG